MRTWWWRNSTPPLAVSLDGTIVTGAGVESGGRLDQYIEREVPMDIGKAFGYVFDDEKWVSKVLIGGLIFLIPFIGQFVIGGYALKVAQNVSQGNPRPLPEWSEFVDHLTRGFFGWVIQLVYFIPVIILNFLTQILIGVGGAATSDGRGEPGAGALLGLCLVPIVFVLAIICGLALMNALARYIVFNNFSEAFKFNEVFSSLRGSIGPWLMLLLLAIIAGFVASLGIIACGIGVLFTAAYAQMVIGHGLGQTIARLYPRTTYDPPVGYTPPPSTTI